MHFPSGVQHPRPPLFSSATEITGDDYTMWFEAFDTVNS